MKPVLCDTCHKPIAHPFDHYGIPKRFCGRKCQRDWWRKVSCRQAQAAKDRREDYDHLAEGTVGLFEKPGIYRRV